jgi:hypothetical protein
LLRTSWRANSGGGIIVFGVDSSGVPTGASFLALAQTDPADVGNKVSKYTGPVQLDFEMRELKKQGKKLQAVIVRAAPIPIIFQKPGTYEVAPGKQKTAFGVGTVYSLIGRFWVIPGGMGAACFPRPGNHRQLYRSRLTCLRQCGSEKHRQPNQNTHELPSVWPQKFPTSIMKTFGRFSRTATGSFTACSKTK